MNNHMDINSLFPIQTKPCNVAHVFIEGENPKWLKNDSYEEVNIDKLKGKQEAIRKAIYQNQDLISKYKRLKQKNITKRERKKNYLSLNVDHAQVIQNPLPSKYIHNIFIQLTNDDTSPEVYDCFYFDTKGDRDNLKYDTFYQHHIASYYTNPKFLLLGNCNLINISWLISESLQKKNSPDLSCNRYFAKKIVTRIDKHGSGINVLGREASDSHPKSFIHKKPESIPSGLDNTHVNYLRQVKEIYNVRLAKEPCNVLLWLKFVKFQKKILHIESFEYDSLLDNVDKLGNTKGTNNSTTLQLCSKQLAIIEKALTFNPDNVDILFTEVRIIFDAMCKLGEAFLRFGPEVTDEIDENVLQLKWAHLLKVVSERCPIIKILRIWRTYLRYVVKAASNLYSYANFNFITNILEVYKRFFSQALTKMLTHKLLVQAELKAIQIAALEALTMVTHLLKSAGYTEYAVAIYQALIEFNFYIPAHVANFSHDKKIECFKLFWENESTPKIGEKGSFGWKSFDGCNGDMKCLYNMLASPDIDPSYFKSLASQQYKGQLDETSRITALQDQEISTIRSITQLYKDLPLSCQDITLESVEVIPPAITSEREPSLTLGQKEEGATWCSIENCRQAYQFLPTRSTVDQSSTCRTMEDPELCPTWLNLEPFILWLNFSTAMKKDSSNGGGISNGGGPLHPTFLLLGLVNGLWNVLGWINPCSPDYAPSVLATILLTNPSDDHLGMTTERMLKNINCHHEHSQAREIDSRTIITCPPCSRTVERDLVDNFTKFRRTYYRHGMSEDVNLTNNVKSDYSNMDHTIERALSHVDVYDQSYILDFSLNLLSLLLPIFSVSGPGLTLFTKLIARILAYAMNCIQTTFLSSLIDARQKSKGHNKCRLRIPNLPFENSCLTTFERFLKRILKLTLFKVRFPANATDLWIFYATVLYIKQNGPNAINQSCDPNAETSLVNVGECIPENPIPTVIYILCRDIPSVKHHYFDLRSKLSLIKLCLSHFAINVERSFTLTDNGSPSSSFSLFIQVAQALSTIDTNAPKSNVHDYKGHIFQFIQELYRCATVSIMTLWSVPNLEAASRTVTLTLNDICDALSLYSIFTALLNYLGNVGDDSPTLTSPSFAQFEQVINWSSMARTDLITSLTTVTEEPSEMREPALVHLDKYNNDHDINRARLLHTYDNCLFYPLNRNILNAYTLAMAHALTPSLASYYPLQKSDPRSLTNASDGEVDTVWERIKIWVGRFESILVHRFLSIDPYLCTALSYYTRVQALKVCRSEFKGIVHAIITGPGGFTKVPFYRTLLNLFSATRLVPLNVLDPSDSNIASVEEVLTNDGDEDQSDDPSTSAPDPSPILLWVMLDNEWNTLCSTGSNHHCKVSTIQHINTLLDKLLANNNVDKSLAWAAALNFMILTRGETNIQACKDLFYKSLRDIPYSKILYANATISASTVFHKNVWDHVAAPSENVKGDPTNLSVGIIDSEELILETQQRAALISVMETMADKGIRIRTLLPEIHLYKKAVGII